MSSSSHEVRCPGQNPHGRLAGSEQVDELTLPVEIKHTDYRDLQGKFDHILSVETLEHVAKNYRTFMKIGRNLLRDNGFFLLHTLGATLPIRE